MSHTIHCSSPLTVKTGCLSKNNKCKCSQKTKTCFIEEVCFNSECDLLLTIGTVHSKVETY